ncbi:MAG TPA: flagellar motor protein MotB [Steroidobacteraceae bacterium]|nr:flagellar motor protein MotB [Steroidobacteraceae bacterium]
MDNSSPQPIVIKRIVVGQGQHNGSWKVAFADFATAMMAFFLMMWLMGGTTAEQKGGISQYFKNPSAVQGASPTPSPTAVQGPGGPSSSLIKLGGSTELYKNPAPAKGRESDDPAKKAVEDPAKAAEEAAKQAQAAREEQADSERLDSLEQDLHHAIDAESKLKPFKDQILIDKTVEGLRIQIVDKDSHSMFDIGSATLKDYSMAILLELAKAIAKVPNRISITGHTDAGKYLRQDYSNWELSTDRANAARRALIAGGLPANKIGRVVGLADTAMLSDEKPDDPGNRRISIIVMNKRTEEAIRQESVSLLSVQQEKTPPLHGNPSAAAATSEPEAQP